MILILERIPKKFVILKDWKKLIKLDLICKIILFIFPIIYSKYVDPMSTFKTILSIYFVFILFIIGKLSWEDKKTNIILIFIFCMLIWGGVIFLTKGVTISLNFATNENAFEEYFFFNSPLFLQWFYPNSRILIGLSLGFSILFSLYLKNNTDVPLATVAQFFLSALFFALVFSHYMRPRYFFHLEIWYILPMALGLYSTFYFMELLLKNIFEKFISNHSIAKNMSVLISLALMFANINFNQILLPSFYKDTGFMPITTEYYYDLDEAHQYITSNFNQGDVLIYSVYGSYVKWTNEPNFSSLYYFDYEEDDSQYINSIIESNPSGWIVLDKWRGQIYATPLPFKDFYVGDKKVTYVGLIADEHIWRW